MTDSPKRILIYRIGSLGDTVVALPSLHQIARAFPNSERRLLTNFPVQVKAPPSAAVLENTGLVHGYFRYAVGTRSVRGLLALAWQLIRWRPSALVYLNPARGVAAARRDVLFFRLCGIRTIIGAPLTDSMQRNLRNENDTNHESEAQRLTRNIAALGKADLANASNWSLHLTPVEHERAGELLAPIAGRPFFAISLGTKVLTNEWGRDRWRELLRRLALAYPGHALVAFGAPIDKEQSDYVAEGWLQASPSTDSFLNLCGQLSPRESAAALSRARLFIGHDSGPMHLAASVQTQCVAIFSARGLPGVWFPFGNKHKVLYRQVDCHGCGLMTCTVEQKKCIYSITVDEVFDQVDSAMNTQPEAEMPPKETDLPCCSNLMQL